MRNLRHAVQGMDILFAALSLTIYGLDLLLPCGRAIIVLLVIVVILAGRSKSSTRVLVWTGISVMLTVSGYFIRHGIAIYPIFLARRGICLLALVGAACVALRNQWLERARQAQARLLERAAAAVFVRDRGDKIIAWSAGAEQLYGFKPENILGRHAAEIFGASPVSDPAQYAQMQTGRWQGERQRITQAGKKITVLCHWAVQRNRKGGIAAILESSTDITEYKAAEARIAEREEHFRGVFEMAGVAIWEEDFSYAKPHIAQIEGVGIADVEVDFNRLPAQMAQILQSVRVTTLNRASSILMQATDTILFRENVGSIILNCPDSIQAEFLTALFEGRPRYHAETTLTTMQGERRNVLLSANFEDFYAGMAKILLSAVDITERKQAENALLLSMKNLSQVMRDATLGEVTSWVGMAVEQPLASIIANSRAAEALLESETEQNGAVEEIIQAVITEAKKASAIITNVRNLMKKN